MQNFGLTDDPLPHNQHVVVHLSQDQTYFPGVIQFTNQHGILMTSAEKEIFIPWSNTGWIEIVPESNQQIKQ